LISSSEKRILKLKIKLFGHYFWKSNGDGTESPDFCEGEIPKRIGATRIVPLYQIDDDLIEKLEISGPAVDALNNRKESDDGPTEQEVNDQLREYLKRPVCTCMDQASMDYCLNKDKCRSMPRSLKDLDMLGLL
jgi:hypothetical protein